MDEEELALEFEGLKRAVFNWFDTIDPTTTSIRVKPDSRVN